MRQSEPLTKRRAREVLEQAREDISMLMSRRFDDLEEAYRLLAITDELWRGTQSDEPPAVSVRSVMERAG